MTAGPNVPNHVDLNRQREADIYLKEKKRKIKVTIDNLICVNRDISNIYVIISYWYCLYILWSSLFLGISS